MGSAYSHRNSRVLQTQVTKTATYSGTVFAPGATPSGALDGMGEFVDLIVTLNIVSAIRTDETYDFYITTGDGTSSWDIVHFPQVATTGAKTFTATVSGRVLPQNVTTASPGVAAVTSGTLATVSGGTHAIKSLGAGIVRHGPWGDRIGHEVVIAGSAPSIVYSIVVTPKR
jgi:hypothetical protein